MLPLAAEEELQSAEPQGQRRRAPRPARSPIAPAAAVAQTPPAAGNILIQAGSFKSRENADRARTLLGAIAQVEVAPVEAGGATVFRVRVGPFADRGEAAAALARVNGAGYAGARIVTN